MTNGVSLTVQKLLLAGLLAGALFGCGKPESAEAPIPNPPAAELPEPAEDQAQPEKIEKPAAEKPDQATSSGPITVVDLHGNEWQGEPKELPRQNSLPVRLAPESRPAETDAAAYSLRTDSGHLLSMSFQTPLTAQQVREFYDRELNGAIIDDLTGTVTGTAKGYDITVLISEGAETLYEIQVWA